MMTCEDEVQSGTYVSDPPRVLTALRPGRWRVKVGYRRASGWRGAAHELPGWKEGADLIWVCTIAGLHPKRDGLLQVLGPGALRRLRHRRNEIWTGNKSLLRDP